MHFLFVIGALLLGVAGAALVACALSWSLRPLLDRAGTSRLRGLLLIAFALSGAATCSAGESRNSPSTVMLGIVIVGCAAIHAIANSGAPTPETRARRVRRSLFGGAACIAVAIAMLSQERRVKLWRVERDLGAIQQQSAGLVAAIDAFRAEHGRSPESDAELLDSAGAHFVNGLERVRWRIEGSDVSETGLVVDDRSFLSFDYFVYAPGVDLPSDLPATRFGDWVYYDE